MGDLNQLKIVSANLDLLRGPILEVGSKDYGSTQNFRELKPDADYVGTDIAPGRGVDVVADLAADFDSISATFDHRRFNTVICFSVLEHCKNPFKMAENMTRLLNDGGTLLVSVPFSWKVHGFPSDYWRFTSDGVRLLFPDIDFDDARGTMSTSKVGEIKPIDANMAQANLSVPAAVARGDYGRVRGFIVRAARRLRALPFIFEYPYLHPPVMITMVGRKRTVVLPVSDG